MVFWFVLRGIYPNSLTFNKEHNIIHPDTCPGVCSGAPDSPIGPPRGAVGAPTNHAWAPRAPGKSLVWCSLSFAIAQLLKWWCLESSNIDNQNQHPHSIRKVFFRCLNLELTAPKGPFSSGGSVTEWKARLQLRQRCDVAEKIWQVQIGCDIQKVC
jgi:hypothetical protein